MNTAIIFAGGTGKRMNTKSVPKQFLELYGKPIIIYTLEKFENNSEVDAVVIACLEGWIPQLKKYLNKFDIHKVRAVVPGGSTGQESIYNGLLAAAEFCPDDTIVLIHDGVRPLISGETITAAIKCAEEKGNAITVTPAIETVFVHDNSDTNKVGRILNRKQCMMAKAPQCFQLGELLELHKRALKEGRTDFIDSATMMEYYGRDLYMIEGNMENIKITTPVDFYMFKAILDAQENSQIFGI